MTSVQLYRLLQHAAGDLNHLAAQLFNDKQTAKATEEEARKIVAPLAEKLGVELN